SCGSSCGPTGRSPSTGTRRARPLASSSESSRSSRGCDGARRRSCARRARAGRGRTVGRRQARRARARARGAPRGRPRAPRGLPRSREDVDRAVVRAGDVARVLAHPVHARPHAERRDRLVDVRPTPRRVHVPAGTDLHEPPPRRRDQPRSAEDAGCAPGGDAGASGDERGRDADAAAAVPRAGHAEPDRVRGHVSAARGPARPFPRSHRRRLPRARRRDRHAAAPARPDARRGRAPARRRPRDAARDAAGARAGARRPGDRGLHRRSRIRDARIPPARRRREPARLARAPQALTRESGARRPRLRGAGGREGRRGPGARAPPDTEARALGAADPRRGRRRRGARDRADAAGGGRAARSRMTRFDAPRLPTYAGLAAVGLLAGLFLGRVELVALARERALEGEEVVATVALTSAAGADRVDVFLPLPDELAAERNPRAVRLVGAERAELEVVLRCERWGAFALGPALVRASDRLGFHRWEAPLGPRQPLRVYPTAETLRTLVAPLETQVFVGNQTSRARAEGIEFADLREWQPGDRLRSVNWRASARRNALWVNQQHPERNADVVLFLDTFTDVRSGARGTFDATVRAATSLAHRYLQRKDRVGVVAFGGYVSWLLPSSGVRQLYRIVDSLLQTDVVLSFAAKGIDLLPRRTLPPKALVLAVSPLLDARTAAALLDLRARGFDLVVIEVSPVPFVVPAGDTVS